MASPSIEFFAVLWKRRCCDVELKGLRFDSSRRLGFFLVTPRDNTNTSSFNLSICFYDLIHDGERLVYINSLEILLEERSSYAAVFSFTFLSFTLHDEPYFLPPLWAYLSWRVTSLQKYTLAYRRRIQFWKNDFFSRYDVLAKYLRSLLWSWKDFPFLATFGCRRLLKLVDWRSRHVCKYAFIMKARSIVEEMSIHFYFRLFPAPCAARDNCHSRLG